MNTTKLPGWGGEVQDFLSGLPGVDHGHAVGGALDVLSYVGGRELQLPSVKNYAITFIHLVGADGRPLVEAVEELLATVDNRPPPPGPVGHIRRRFPCRVGAVWTRGSSPISVRGSAASTTC